MTEAREVPPMDKWRCMEKDPPPKDGQWLLLHGRHARHGVEVQMVCCWGGDYWLSSDDGYGAYITPTHWMPLPPPPQEPNHG